MQSPTNPRNPERRPLARRLFAGDGPLFFGSLVFALAAVVVYFVVISLGVHP